MLGKHLFLISTLLILGIAGDSFSQVSSGTYGGIYLHNFRSRIYSNTPYFHEYVDFSTNSAYANKNYVTRDLPKSTIGVKSHGLVIQMLDYVCLEISTTQQPNADGYFQATTYNADTKIWVINPTAPGGINWTAVSDDYNGTYYSKFRLWTVPGGFGLHLLFAAYSSLQNNIDYYYVVQKLPASSSSQCQSPTINFLDVTTNPWTFSFPNT